MEGKDEKNSVLAFWYSADSITHTSSELPFSLRPKGTSSVTQTAVVLISADIFICKYFFMQLTISQNNSCEAQVTCHVKKIDIQRNQGEKENLWPYDKKLDKEYGQEIFMTALLNAVGQLYFFSFIMVLLTLLQQYSCHSGFKTTNVELKPS